MISFSIGGKSVNPSNMKDVLMKMVLENVRTQIADKVGAIRDPDTGEFPSIVVRGDSIDKLTIHVEGSPKLVALVSEKLGIGEQKAAGASTMPTTPVVFLSYTSDDLKIAEKIANKLRAKGIETWWDKWCIYPGDSLRQKIDEGLSSCTHFLVLLTPQSISKPWVNQEMDAALVRKLNSQCRFLPVRHGLPASKLPPLLAGMFSPEIETDTDAAIDQLINDIYEIGRKPPLGAPPTTVSQAMDVQTGYSTAASAIAKVIVNRSKNGTFGDPSIRVDELASETGMSLEDAEDALYELSAFLKISSYDPLVKGAFFSEFDKFWKPWNPEDDAYRLAADIVNDPEFPKDPKAIAERYTWTPRRLNPTIHYLMERDIIGDYRAMGTQPFATSRIVGNSNTRRFVKSRTR